MEAARLGLGDYPLSSLGRGPATSSANQAAMAAAGLLGASNQAAAMSLMDPWLAASPLLGSTLSHALPGFLAHPQNCYPSYLTPPTSAAAAASILSAAHHQQQQHQSLLDARASGGNKMGAPSSSPILSPLSVHHPHHPHSHHHGSSMSPGSPASVSPGEVVHRSSSIAALRLKAKEHLDSLSKTIQIN